MIRILIVVVALARVSHAYPQFQLVKDQTCSSCHLSPAGGGLLSENGMSTAENISQFGMAPEFFYNKLPVPKWLELGGDLRGATGYDDAGITKGAVVFPMQAEVNVAATFDAFSVHATAGVRDPQYVVPNSYDPATLFASREHWLQWQQKPGETEGLFVRVGRFMPVYGLRFVEHPYYDRRYGGTPLFGETYAAAVEYIDPKWEVHATGFIKDPLVDAIELGNGATVYAEARLTQSTLVGVESKLDVTPDDRKIYGGVTAKQLVTKDVLVEGEVELVHQKVGLGGVDNQLVATVVGSYFLGPFLLDVGINLYHKNLHFILLDQEAVDLNVHWFATSHVELLLTNRIQTLAVGADGPASGYSLLQLHYRL